MSIELISEDLFRQNPIAIGLEYLHYNPVKQHDVKKPENITIHLQDPIAIGFVLMGWAIMEC